MRPKTSDNDFSREIKTFAESQNVTKTIYSTNKISDFFFLNFA